MSLANRDEIVKSLRTYKSRRDSLLHGDVAETEHHLKRFVDFCEANHQVLQILNPLREAHNVDIQKWWLDFFSNEGEDGKLSLNFGDDPDREFVLRFGLIKDMALGERQLWAFGHPLRIYKGDESTQRFLSLIVRPFCEDLSQRLEDLAKIASPEARALQAVPLDRLPADSESRIFLSHKTADKHFVRTYYNTLKQLGFSPWMDEADLLAGTPLDRGIHRGFEESCAAVFFITENFIDERYLAKEVDYAVIEQDRKEARFAIIVLRFSDKVEVPKLLERFTYKDVTEHLMGLYHIVQALPIELGPVRWKQHVVTSK